MENRDRDKLSRNRESTDAGDLNRETSSRIGNRNDESSAEFGQNIGRSEDLNEPNRRGEKVGSEGMRGSTGTGMSGSTGMGPGSRERSGSVENVGDSKDVESDNDRIGSSSKGRH